MENEEKRGKSIIESKSLTENTAKNAKDEKTREIRKKKKTCQHFVGNKNNIILWFSIRCHQKFVL